MDRQANVEQTDGHGESLEQVEQRFRRWRESRKQGQRIPAVLWAAAAGPAKQHGVHRVALVKACGWILSSDQNACFISMLDPLTKLSASIIIGSTPSSPQTWWQCPSRWYAACLRTAWCF